MIRRVLPWLIFSLFGLFLVGNNFHAKLGIIDDHEIAMFLGNDGRIKLTEIPQTVMQMTEVGKWGSYLRYRPSYYTMRVVETALWRDNASLWYFYRYLLLVVSMYLGWKITSKYFPEIVAYLFIFYVMTMPFWPDLLTRLGPSEIYAVPALLLFIYGLITDKLWMIFVGYVICIGSKENFLFMFPFLLSWAGSKIYWKKFTKIELTATIVMLGYTVLIVSAIMVATAKAGADIYGRQISYRYRITKFFLDIPIIIKSRHILPAILMMVIAPFTKAKPWKYIALMLSIIFVIFTQYVFYVNQIPTNSRYDFPALLLFPVLDLIAIKLVFEMLKKNKLLPIVKMIIFSMIVIGASIFVFHRGYTLTQRQSRKVVEATRSFNIQLDAATKTLRDNPQPRVNFVSNALIDFEPIVSVSRYLNSRSISNEFALDYSMEKPPNDAMDLHDRLTKVTSGELGDDHLFDRFSKYEVGKSPCYSITFGRAAPLPECPEIARF